jgi:hypothetical protein
METLSLVCQICVEFLNIRVGKTGTGKLIPQRARRQLVRQLQLERYMYKLNHSDISGEWSIQQKGYKRSNGSKQIDSKEIAET